MGRTLRPVPAPRRAEMLAHRQRLRHREKVRADELQYQASPSPAVLRRVTLQHRACRVVTPSAGRVRAARPNRRVRRPALWTIPRTPRPTQTRPGPRPILPAVHSQVSADPRPERLAAAPVRLELLPVMPVRYA